MNLGPLPPEGSGLPAQFDGLRIPLTTTSPTVGSPSPRSEVCHNWTVTDGRSQTREPGSASLFRSGAARSVAERASKLVAIHWLRGLLPMAWRKRHLCDGASRFAEAYAAPDVRLFAGQLRRDPNRETLRDPPAYEADPHANQSVSDYCRGR